MRGLKTKLINLKNRLSRSFIFLAFLILFIQCIFIFGLGSCSAFGPDETVYLKVFKGIEVGYSFAGTHELIYKAYYLPGKSFTMMGFSEIQSLRLSSVFWSQLTVFFIWQTLGKSNVFKLRTVDKFLILLFPSAILFLSLGLREALLFFLLTFIFYSYSLIIKNHIVVGTVFLSSGFILLSFTKFYLYLIVLASLLILVIFYKKFNSKIFILMFAAIPSLALNQSLVLDQISQLRIDFNSDYQLLSNYDLFSFGSESSTLQQLRVCSNQNLFGFLGAPINLLLEATSTPEVSAPEVSAPEVSAPEVSAPEVSNTDFYAADKPRELIVLSHFPLSLVNFMFGPIPGIGGGFTFLGLLDSIGWLGIYVFFTLILIGKNRYRLIFDEISLFAASFFLIFTFLSAAIEVNSGTLFRHRTLLLIPLLILLSRLVDRSETTPVSSPDTPGNYNQ